MSVLLNTLTQMQIPSSSVVSFDSATVDIQIGNSAGHGISAFIDDAFVTVVNTQSYELISSNYPAGVVTIYTQLIQVESSTATVGFSIGFQGFNNYNLGTVGLNINNPISVDTINGLSSSELNNVGVFLNGPTGVPSDGPANSLIPMIKTGLDLTAGFSIHLAIEAAGEALDPLGGFLLGFVLDKVAGNLIDQFFDQSNSNVNTVNWDYNSNYQYGYNFINYLTNEVFFQWDFSSQKTSGSFSIHPTINIGLPYAVSNPNWLLNGASWPNSINTSTYIPLTLPTITFSIE